MSGQSEETNREAAEESMNLCPFTTLSTIAVQAGQSQIVISVLKSGSRVHLQLVQVQPGLCDVGSNPEENQMLIQEQQQLLEKLKKHENEVLAVVEKKADESKRRSRGVTEQRTSRKWEEKERLKFAMKMSITEGWSLLLHLLERRLEVLNLASDFYRQATEFAASIDRFEGLQVKPGEGGPTARQLSYDTMRKDLLKKSLHLLTSCSILMQELRVLQRSEALQRKGGVLQVTKLKEEEEEVEGSPHSRQVLQRLEELVEELQDRRRRADQAVKLQLRQPADGMEVQKIESDQRLLAQWDCRPTVLQMQDQNLQFESISPVLLSTFNLEETKDSNPGSGPDLCKSVEPRSKCEDFRKFLSGSTSDRKFEIEAYQKPNINTELTGSLDLQAGFSSTFKSLKTADLHSGLGPNVDQGFVLDLIPESTQLQAADQISDWGSSKTEKQQAGSRSLSPKVHRLLTEFREDDFSSGSESNLKLCSRSENKTKKTLQTRTEETNVLETGSRMDPEVKSKSVGAENSESDVRKNLKNRFRTEGNPAPGFDPKPKSRSEASQRAGSGSEETRRQELILKLKETKTLESGFKSQLQSESGSKENPQSRSEDRSNLQPGDVREPEVTLKEDRHAPAAATRPLADLLIIMEDDAPEGEGHAHFTLLTNQRQQRLSLLEWLEEKVCRWTQLLSDSWKSEWWLSEAEHALKTHLQLQKHILSADHDVESWEQILGPNKESSKTGPHRHGEVGRQMTFLKALTKRLRGGCVGTSTGPNGVQQTLPESQSLGDADRVGRVLKELQVLRKKTDCRVQLLQSYVGLLRTAQQVDVEMKELREHFQRRKEEDEEEAESGQIEIETLYVEMKKKIDAAEELGDSCIHAATMGSELNSQTLLLMVQQTMKQIGESKLEMEQLRDQEEDARLCREYQKRLSKTLQDLKCVSELLDSCTCVDLGLDLNTSKLLEHFRQARPHFSQLDAEVENMLKSWPKVKQILARLKKLQGDMVEEEDVSKMVKLQGTVKSKIQQSEAILELTSRFHIAAKQLEGLLHAEFRRTSTGFSDVELSRHGERRQQILNLFKTSTALGGDICAAVKSTDWTRFRVEQLEARLLSLDSLCGSWLSEAAQREEELHRDQLTHLLQDSINQLWDSFKELKKCFSNTRFNYLKRNNRTRNLKVVRNQLQQVEVYGEKLQAIRKRVHGVEAQMSLQVKDGGMAQQLEDTINELRKQMGELERSLCEHQKTLDMTSRLHQAMQEYQFWCEEANSTITRVVKFSTECRSPKAISTLHCQLEKFVWPTVPEQEERISQITELAEKLYGVEEGQRYVEKTMKKHCEIVASIRELSRQLVELEAKLKMDEEETQEGESEEQMTEKRKQRDNRSTEEDDGMSELKETGHTPEVTAEDAGKEAFSGKQTSAKREASFPQTFHQDGNGSFTQCFNHSSSLSCSPVTNRRVNTVHSQPQAVTTQPQLTTSASQKTHEMGKAATSCGLNITPAQDSSAEVELQKDAITEDCFSNDEYDCASPDDISLPPLAETPESTMFQSDVEEALCISSHSLRVSRVSCQGQSEQSTAGADTGSVPQQRHSNPTEGCSSPSVCLHSSTSRFKSESSSLAKSPFTLPAPRLFPSTLCTSLTTSEISSDIFSMSREKSIGSPKPSLDLVKPGSSPVCRLNTVDYSSDSNVPDMRSAPPPRETKNTHTSEALNLNLACLQSLNDQDSDLHKCRIHPEDAGLNNSNGTCPQSKTVTCKNTNFTQFFNDREIIPHQDWKYTQNSRESTVEDADPTRTSCPQDRNPSTAVPQSSKAALQIHLPQSYTGSRSRLVQKVLPLQNEVSSDCTPRTKSCTTATTVIKHSVKGQPSIEEIFKLNKSLNHSIRETQMGNVHSSPEAECVSSSKTLSMEQSLQTVCSLNESKSTCQTQPCVHGPSMNHSGSVKPTAPLQPEAQTQALSQQVNPHVSRPAPPHPLTPHQDPDICLPIAVREEIRLTPQIKGPPHPPGSPCFTRPLSQTAMVEGSPVMLEVEVMGHQDPMLTWWVAYNHFPANAEDSHNY
uniref:Coiled-coil domain-containing protein 141 n=1 Tax=Oryzias latipes TaxID=8090 RepID=A0A3B3HTD9_ORYLA